MIYVPRHIHAVCLSNRHSTQYRLQAAQQVRRVWGASGLQVSIWHRAHDSYGKIWLQLTISMNKNYVFFIPQKFYFDFSIFVAHQVPEDRTLWGAFKSTELLSLHLIFFGSQFSLLEKVRKLSFTPPLLSLAFPLIHTHHTHTHSNIFLMQFLQGGGRTCDSFNSLLFKRTNDTMYWMSDYAQGHEVNRKWMPFLTCPCVYVIIDWFWIPLHLDSQPLQGKCVYPF